MNLQEAQMRMAYKEIGAFQNAQDLLCEFIQVSQLKNQRLPHLLQIVNELHSLNRKNHLKPEYRYELGVQRLYKKYYPSDRREPLQQVQFPERQPLIPQSFRCKYINRMDTIIPDFLRWKEVLRAELDRLTAIIDPCTGRYAPREPYLSFAKVASVLKLFEDTFTYDLGYMALGGILADIFKENIGMMPILLYFVISKLGPDYMQRESVHSPINLEGYGSVSWKTLFQAISEAVWVPERLMSSTIQEFELSNLAQIARDLYLPVKSKDKRSKAEAKRERGYQWKRKNEEKTAKEFFQSLQRPVAENRIKKQLSDVSESEDENSDLEEQEGEILVPSLDFWGEYSNSDYTFNNQKQLSFAEVILAICAIKFQAKDETQKKRILVYIMRRANDVDSIYHFLRFFVEVEEEDRERYSGLFLSIAQFLNSQKQKANPLPGSQFYEQTWEEKLEDRLMRQDLIEGNLECPLIDELLRHGTGEFGGSDGISGAGGAYSEEQEEQKGQASQYEEEKEIKSETQEEVEEEQDVESKSAKSEKETDDEEDENSDGEQNGEENSQQSGQEEEEIEETEEERAQRLRIEREQEVA